MIAPEGLSRSRVHGGCARFPAAGTGPALTPDRRRGERHPHRLFATRQRMAERSPSVGGRLLDGDGARGDRAVLPVRSPVHAGGGGPPSAAAGLSSSVFRTFFGRRKIEARIPSISSVRTRWTKRSRHSPEAAGTARIIAGKGSRAWAPCFNMPALARPRRAHRHHAALKRCAAIETSGRRGSHVGRRRAPGGTGRPAKPLARTASAGGRLPLDRPCADAGAGHGSVGFVSPMQTRARSCRCLW